MKGEPTGLANRVGVESKRKKSEINRPMKAYFLALSSAMTQTVTLFVEVN